MKTAQFRKLKKGQVVECIGRDTFAGLVLEVVANFHEGAVLAKFADGCVRQIGVPSQWAIVKPKKAKAHVKHA